MSKIRIETLTSVHIGSGEMLRSNTDFVVCKEGEDYFLYVVDPSKVLKIIGEEHLQNWLSSIENGENTIDMVKRFNPQTKCKDFATRSILSYSSVRVNETLKECIHDGMGVPYIPGSSIKGAIRTAILSSFSDNETAANNAVWHDKFGKLKSNSKRVEGELFGSNPNCDVFRFIKVGDAYFAKECEVAYRMQSLNIRSSHHDLMDASKQQLVEAISEEMKSTFQLKIDQKQYLFSKVNWHDFKNRLGELNPSFSDVENLFALINRHTAKLVDSEIVFWKKQNVDKEGADNYLDCLEEINSHIKKCSSKECVLRIGHSSGWRFITGAWCESSKSFVDVVSIARPNNKRYEEYVFPKTRRVDEDGYPLGFVKLTIVED